MTETNVTVIAPYCHELNAEGTGCASDCPACRWHLEHRDKLPFFSTAYMSHLLAHIFKSLRAHPQEPKEGL